MRTIKEMFITKGESLLVIEPIPEELQEYYYGMNGKNQQQLVEIFEIGDRFRVKLSIIMIKTVLVARSFSKKVSFMR